MQYWMRRFEVWKKHLIIYVIRWTLYLKVKCDSSWYDPFKDLGSSLGYFLQGTGSTAASLKCQHHKLVTVPCLPGLVLFQAVGEVCVFVCVYLWLSFCAESHSRSLFSNYTLHHTSDCNADPGKCRLMCARREKGGNLIDFKVALRRLDMIFLYKSIFKHVSRGAPKSGKISLKLKTETRLQFANLIQFYLVKIYYVKKRG